MLIGFEREILLPQDPVTSQLRKFGHKYTHSKALKKLTTRSDNGFIENVSRFCKNAFKKENLRFFVKLLKNVNFRENTNIF
jgi:hypothetical protein